MKIKKFLCILFASAMTFSMVACTNKATNENQTQSNVADEKAQYDGKLEFDHSMELTYAKNFSVDYYKGGYKLIKVKNNPDMLVVPEGMKVPADLDKETCVLQQPINNMLIASTPTTSLFTSIDMLDAISLTTFDVDSWYIDSVKKQISSGKMKYIGEFKAPDFEAIAASGTKMSVFSSMLPEDVNEKLKQLGVNVLIDRAPEEDHPLARVEWVKLYGAMFNKETEANAAFDAQNKLVAEIEKQKNTGKTVAIFYVSSKGELVARNSEDYMAKMVNLAGGKYILDGKVGVGKTGTTKMEKEAFFDDAKDADVIIYVWSLGGKPSTLNDFIARSEILSEMKAVKEGNVWCTTPDFFQISNTMGNMVDDINKMLNSDGSKDKFTYLYKLK